MRYATGKRNPINKKSLALEDFIISYPSTPLVDTAPDYVFPMDLNDRVGICVPAGYDHFIQVVTGLLTGTQHNLTEDQLVALYKTQNPNFDLTSATHGPGSMYDNGMDMQLFLEYLVNNKLIVGFGRINWTKRDQMQAAIYMGLAIIGGVQLRDAQYKQFDNGLWDFEASSPIDGGHCILYHGYKEDGYQLVTWGKTIPCTEAFVLNQADEMWFALTQAHIDHPGFRNHFDLKAFSDAVKAITDGKIVIPVPTVQHPTLKLTRPMTHNDAVKELQTLLHITADGWFGNQTQSAVMAYQRAHGLVPDGIVGPLTWTSLLGTTPPKKSLLEAQIQVESGGNDNAMGDMNIPDHAYGCLQIRQPVCTDVNNTYGTSYTPQQMLGNRALSIEVWTKYLAIYATQAHLGHAPTDEDRARIWNGGPNGWSNPATVDYWKKVQALMQ